MIPAAMTVPRFLGEGRVDWIEKPVPEPRPGELILKVGANALCGTDRLQYRFGARVTPGHEAAGEVVATGPGTTTRVGARGAVYLMEYCGTCRSCARGHTNQCSDKGRDFGITVDGGYAPFELVAERCFFPIGDDLPFDEATMLLDVMGTSAHAIGRAKLIRDDVESVLIAAAGPIGLGLVAMAPLILGEGVKVLVTDVAPYRLKLCERLGAMPVLIGADDVAGVARDHGLHSVDVAFDAAGKSDARRTGLDALGKRGVLVCVGHGLEIKVSPDLIAPERGILGFEYFRYDELAPNLHHFATTMRLIEAGVASLRFAGGAVGGLVGSYSSSYAYRGAHAPKLNGTLGRVMVEDTVRRFAFRATGSETAEVWEPGYFNDHDRGFARMVDRHAEAMLKAFAAGEPPSVHARAGRRAPALAEACIRSFETGRRVDVAPCPA